VTKYTARKERLKHLYTQETISTGAKMKARFFLMMFLPGCIVYDSKQGSLNHYSFARAPGCAGKFILGSKHRLGCFISA
jgi:hypothetical protein